MISLQENTYTKLIKKKNNEQHVGIYMHVEFSYQVKISNH